MAVADDPPDRRWPGALKVRSRTAEAVVFRWSSAPPYVRRARRLDVALPWLCLNGISTGQMAEALQAIWMAETREQAEKALDRFLATYGAKYPKATECLAKDRDMLPAFVFKLGLAAERRWRRIRGFEQLAKIIEGVKFTDGVETESSDRVAA